MKNAEYYQTSLKRPSWAPPAKVFGPVWTFLYILIAISFGTVFEKGLQGVVPFAIVLPFILNIIFNLLYTPIQFKLKNNYLALLDILLVLATLIWALIVIHPYYSFVTYINIPYMLWVTFATILQISITRLNR